jgi:hypothetical protein
VCCIGHLLPFEAVPVATHHTAPAILKRVSQATVRVFQEASLAEHPLKQHGAELLPSSDERHLPLQLAAQLQRHLMQPGVCSLLHPALAGQLFHR